MHKNMQEIQNKDWSKMQAYFDWNKNEYAPALKAMALHQEFDFQKMFLEESSLFVFFVRIHAEKNPKYDVENFWKLHYDAYQTLKNDGVLSIDLTEQKLQQIKDFEAKLAGPCLVSKDDLENSMTVKKKKKEVSVHFDYHEVLDLIEKHYDINVRGIFDKLKREQINQVFGKYFPIEIYSKVSNTSPVDSLEANYLSIISDTIGEQIEYIDFWHYMLDADFSSISNGSISRMWEREKEIDFKLEEIINTKQKFQNYISKLIIQVFFKELSQLEEVNPDDGIEFLIEW